MAELIAVLKKKHDLEGKKAWTKIRAVIRKTTRKQNVPVVIVMQKEAGQDYYTIDTTDQSDED